MKQEYVAGFMFQGTRVALIRKQRPQWQRHLLNGIGGHIEENETAMEAMEREFEEETGCKVTDWTCYCWLSSPGFMVYFFHCRGDLSLLKTTTDEEIVICDIGDLPFDVVPNLRWLIPMALDLVYTANVRVNSLPGDS